MQECAFAWNADISAHAQKRYRHIIIHRERLVCNHVSSLVPRPFFAGEGKNGLGTTVRACVGYSVKSR